MTDTRNPEIMLQGGEIEVPETIEPLEGPGLLKQILGKIFK